MKETLLKTFYFAVVEYVRNVHSVDGADGPHKVGDKEITLIEFANRAEMDNFFVALPKRLDPDTEAFRVLATHDTAYELQKVMGEVEFHRKRMENIPIPDRKQK